MNMIKGLCRLNKVIELPCNWNREGKCGADSKDCIILQVFER